VRYQTEALARWPHPETTDRRSALSFRASHKETLQLLDTELEHLGCTGTPVIGVVTGNPGDVRLDGMLRAKARIEHPGVQLAVVTASGPRSWATDTYERQYSHGLESWQANLRAIALTLEALRAVGRWGAAQGQQYAGFRAIEGPGGNAPSAVPGFASADDAVRWLLELTGESALVSNRNVLRAAKRAHHPDVGGDPAVWARIDVAESVLRDGGLL
jgi:hypothetical protein